MKHRLTSKIYVLKRGGKNDLAARNQHMVAEFFANVCYHRMGVSVPASALYQVQIAADRGHDRVWDGHELFYLSERVESTAFDSKIHLPLFESGVAGVAADVILCNCDVAGQGFANLRVGQDGTAVYRVDYGGCLHFQPAGKVSRGKLEQPTETTVQNVKAANSQDADRARHQLFANVSRLDLAQAAGDILGRRHFKQETIAFLAKNKNLSLYCSDLLTQVLKRLEQLQSLDPVRATSPSLGTPRDRTKEQFEKFVEDQRKRKAEVVSDDRRSSKRPALAPPTAPVNHRPTQVLSGGVGSAAVAVAVGSSAGSTIASAPLVSTEVCRRGAKKKIGELRTKGYEVIDVTGKGEDPRWKAFSPYHPHRNIPVPGHPGEFSETVEGIWQGLKVFVHEGVDLSKLKITGGRGIKRGVRCKARGDILYRFFRGGDGREMHLDYATARKQIYFPAYKWVLGNKLQQRVRDLKARARTTKIVLLDYYDNPDVTCVKQPLSHAQLLKSYLLGQYPA